MTDRTRKVGEHAHAVATTFNKAYQQWAKDNIEVFPQLFSDVEKQELCSIHQHAARFCFVLFSHTAQEIWSYAGDIVGGAVDEDNEKANDAFMHLNSMSFLPAETSRHCYGSTRLLTYQASALAGTLEQTGDPIPELEFSDVMLQMFSTDKEIWEGFSMLLNKDLGFAGLPEPATYVPLEYRRDVFKSLLSQLFGQFENIKSADDGFRLLKENHDAMAGYVAMVAFKNMAATRPCPAPGCEMHVYHHEHARG
ncbi:hypothetical protein [Vibrio parahaemolyticus]|uniref:hypothetical protein n=1 Tax=Vibrio parahaemolyticus TaxID=670 RepID=UPI0023EC7489|nr:hypothetical protein [Vibrio parahaemolyticus]